VIGAAMATTAKAKKNRPAVTNLPNLLISPPWGQF
jgi:hypothetical protein